jgi:hypothetical protein
VQHRSLFGRQLCIAADAASYSALDRVAQHDLEALLGRGARRGRCRGGLDRHAWRTQPQGNGELARSAPWNSTAAQPRASAARRVPPTTPRCSEHPDQPEQGPQPMRAT